LQNNCSKDRSFKSGLIFYFSESKMRLDKYLKVSRVIKRRTVANEACDGGRVSVNGKTARASYEVKLGDIIEVGFGTRTVKLRVESIKETTTKEGAEGMFTIL
jgi:ribosomal 50S subunit-recycling heat shock protein